MYSKKRGEDEVLKAHKKGLNVVIVNPSTIIGAGDEKMNSGVVFRNILINKIKAAPPGGNSIVSVSDAVEGHLLAMKKGKSGERYILNTENINFLEMFNVMAEELGAKKIKKRLHKHLYFPLAFVAWMLEKLNKNSKLTPQLLFFSFKHRYFDSRKAKHELGWLPKQGFRDAVKDAIIYYKDRGLI
jgi:dihydroflavonol-4-reductase